MNRYAPSVKQVYIIGCGGVASWLLPVLIKLMVSVETPPIITLVDGDKLEEKNLDRQLFDPSQIGQFKADALHARYKAEYPKLVSKPAYLAEGADWLEDHALYFGCADNHTARRNILTAIDNIGGKAIIGGNEYTDSEAYFYEPSFKDTGLDPRVYYPELLTNTADDPTRPTSCQGEAAISTPQLVLANSSAANHMLQLWWFHIIARLELDPTETKPWWPIRHFNTFSRFGTELTKQKEEAHATKK